MIPKVLHQVWLGGSRIPDQFLKRWRELHPDWDYRLWNESNLKDTDCWRFIDIAQKNSSKSNIARLYIILTYGGVYADLDVEFIQNVDCLLNHEAFAAKEPHESLPVWPNWYGNAFFGAVSNHSWIKYQYDNLDKYVHKSPPWGPALMTEAAKNAEVNKGLVTIETKLFYPITCHEKAGDRNFSDSYVVHHWDMSWKKEE